MGVRVLGQAQVPGATNAIGRIAPLPRMGPVCLGVRRVAIARRHGPPDVAAARDLCTSAALHGMEGAGPAASRTLRLAVKVLRTVLASPKLSASRLIPDPALPFASLTNGCVGVSEGKLAVGPLGRGVDRRSLPSFWTTFCILLLVVFFRTGARAQEGRGGVGALLVVWPPVGVRCEQVGCGR